MLLLLGVAFLSGVATAVSPCILPVLPVVLSSSVDGDRWRPVGVITGLVVSFALVTMVLSAVVSALNLPPDVLRTAGIVVIGLAGLALLMPGMISRLEGLLARVSQLGLRLQGERHGGFGGGLVLGGALGLVWTPCAGPILAAVIATAAIQGASLRAVAVVIAYALGAGGPMMAIAYGGRWVVGRFRRGGRYAGPVQRLFGALMVIVAVAMAANVDRQFQVWAVSALPAGWSTPLSALEQAPPVHSALVDIRKGDGSVAVAAAAGGAIQTPAPVPTSQGSRVGAGGAGTPADRAQAVSSMSVQAPVRLDNLGPAPNFTGITRWFNTTHPLTMAGLRGKVVLIDFWTYSCINCLRTLPHVKEWYAKYSKLGLVVVGVHTPEFSFEGVPANVGQAIRQLGVTYPVAMDNKYATWTAYNNEYWPAEYLIDAHGIVRHTHFGEGEYATTERVIQQLLGDAGHHVSMPLATTPDTTPNHDQTPETYVGSDRMGNFASPQKVIPGRVQDFTTPRTLAADSFALAGRWRVNPPEATVGRAGASLDFVVTGSKVFVVLSPHGVDNRVRVLLDGKPVVTGVNAGADVKNGVVHVTMDNLYNVVDLGGKVQAHRLRLIFDHAGTEVYSFTFG